VSSITETWTANCRCALCLGPVEVTIKTLCLASRIILSCKDPECPFVYNSPTPTTSAVNEDDDARERSSDYAVNISYVLGFVGNGDGGTEAARVLGLLGLHQTIQQWRLERSLLWKSASTQSWKGLHPISLWKTYLLEYRAVGGTESSPHSRGPCSGGDVMSWRSQVTSATSASSFLCRLTVGCVPGSTGAGRYLGREMAPPKLHCL
jgi:hypothetical protein